MRKITFILLLALAANGCSSYGLSGKREETIVDKTSPNAIKVTFCGNAYMDKKEVERYALQRAAREALSKGCSHFFVTGRDDRSKICSFNPAMNARDLYGPFTLKETGKEKDLPSPEFVEPNVTLTIQCVSADQEIPQNAIDAEEYLRENFSGLQKK